MVFTRLESIFDHRAAALFDERYLELKGGVSVKSVPPKTLFAQTFSTVAKTFGIAEKWADFEVKTFERSGCMLNMPDILNDPIASHAFRASSLGDEIVKMSRLDAQLFHITPTDFQADWLATSLEARAPRMYLEEWKRNMPSIRRRNGWITKMHGIIAMLTGRKEGKSTVLGMDGVVILFNIPGVQVALFSRTKDQACIILDMMKTLAAHHQRAGDFKIEASRSKIVVTHLATGDVRVCQAWSGSGDVRYMQGNNAGLRRGARCFCLLTLSVHSTLGHCTRLEPADAYARLLLCLCFSLCGHACFLGDLALLSNPFFEFCERVVKVVLFVCHRR